jgi:hypothetical protein
MNIKGRYPKFIVLASLHENKENASQYNDHSSDDTQMCGRTLNPKILSSSIRTPSYWYLLRVTTSTYGSADPTSSLNVEPAGSTLSSTTRVIRFPFGSCSLQSHCCGRPLAAACARALRTLYGLKSRTMIGVGMASSIATARWPAVVVIQRTDAGSLSNQRVAAMPHADHGTSMGVETYSGGERKGAQVRSAAGIRARSAWRCTINDNGRVSGKGKKSLVGRCTHSIKTLKKMTASAALSRNGR